MIEHIIDNKKVHIHDNVLSERLVKQWINFYENDASFTLASEENTGVTGSSVFFYMPLDLKDRLETFEIDTWLLPYMTQFDPEFTFSHFHRSYLNILTNGDRITGHVDSTDRYLVCLLFMNPYVENSSDSGFHIEDLYIENKFNRMIVFDGRLFHKAQAPSDDFVRLTLYFGFNFNKTRPSLQKEIYHHSTKKNRWFKSVKQV